MIMFVGRSVVTAQQQPQPQQQNNQNCSWVEIKYSLGTTTTITQTQNYMSRYRATCQRPAPIIAFVTRNE